MNHLYLALAIVSEVIATTALKSSEAMTRPLPTTVSIIGYGVAIWLLSLCMRTLPVGVVYAIWSGVGIALITLFAWLYHRQTVDLPAALGLLLIATGVIVISLFSDVDIH